MKLYLSHSSNHDYTRELYEPLRTTLGLSHDIFFPHDEESSGVDTKNLVPTCDAVLAEVSYPSTGQGIELGWADASGVPIICFHRAGSEVSSALRFVSSSLFGYESSEEMIAKLKHEIEKQLHG